MRKKLISILLCLITLLFTACGKQTQNTEAQISVARNDWYGAVLRMDKMDKDAKSVVSVLDNKNYDIVMGNPQDYWSDGYYHFTFTPLESTFINYTLFLNESDPWATVVENTSAKILEKKAEAQNIIILRDDENEYSLQWQGYDIFDITNEEAYLTRKIHCLYDASHNWAQLIESSYRYADDSRYEEDFLEYAEIDAHRYALQCSKSRLYSEYDDNGNLVKMYYSKLGNEVRDRKEELDMAEEYVVENVFDMDTSIGVDAAPTAYETNPYVYNSEDDSIFSRVDELGYDWVMAESTIDQYVVYENEVLMFRVKNKLSGQYEGFIVSNVIHEPVLNEEDGKYYDPVTGLETSMEEYNTRISKVKDQTEIMNNIIADENKVPEDVSENDISSTKESFEVKIHTFIGDDEVTLTGSDDVSKVYKSLKTNEEYKTVKAEDDITYYVKEDGDEPQPVINNYYITVDGKEVVLHEIDKTTDFSKFTEEVNGPELNSFIGSVFSGKGLKGLYDDNNVIYVVSESEEDNTTITATKLSECKP